MLCSVLLFLTLGQLAFCFVIGHLACPKHDRIRLADMTQDDLTGTIARGWNQLGAATDRRG
ncbi:MULTISPECIES: hypothetical protein [Brevibacterium]|jgi:hypothetical protein|uniref:Uncharacterized protein n=1 Tax=Brevibacterium salitolerans TaxID=1403566 RepID=A0ABN2X4R7_9MICO|nr:hypothetical protein [Brevibacterium sp.]